MVHANNPYRPGRKQYGNRVKKFITLLDEIKRKRLTQRYKFYDSIDFECDLLLGLAKFLWNTETSVEDYAKNRGGLEARGT
jgi:hypothetical protein